MILLELAHEVGLKPYKVSGTQGGEYKSACPRCGGTDRFFIQPNKQMKNCSGYYSCRQCRCSGDTIQFAMDFFGLDFKRAASRINIVMPEKKALFMFPKKQSYITKISPIPDLWTSKANAFIEWAHQKIIQHPDILNVLHKRGLPLEAVYKYKIGWNPKDMWRNREEWGLEQKDESDSKLWLPQGIVVPSLEKNGNVNRIKIRRSNWKTDDKYGKYIAIPGSMGGLSIIGDTNKELMIVIESELDAYATHFAVHDDAFIVAVGSNSKNPDNIVDFFGSGLSR